MLSALKEDPMQETQTSYPSLGPSFLARYGRTRS
jgi:hypothetical protein